MIVTIDTAVLIPVVVICMNGYATTILAKMLFEGTLSRAGQIIGLIMLGANIAAFVLGAFNFLKLLGA